MKFKFAGSSLLALMLAGLTACSDAQTDVAETTPPVQQVQAPAFDKAAMDAVLSGAVERGDVVGVSALIFDEGEKVYEASFGMRDREAGLPVTNDTVWRIYSMTKPVTSALIMDLVEDGLIAVDDPVSKYIPELANMPVVSVGEDGQPAYAPQVRPMTVEDLLLHR